MFKPGEKGMNCPNCKQLMVVLELKMVEIDYCTECKGIWLDAGELEMLLDGVVQKDLFLNSFGKQKKSKERKKKCPICRKKMDKISLPGVSEGQEILVDGCPGKHGIWFDQGELRQVLSLGGLEEGHRVVELLREMFEN
jgi:Zn-finger nucleic acid-binding protein